MVEVRYLTKNETYYIIILIAGKAQNLSRPGYFVEYKEKEFVRLNVKVDSLNHDLRRTRILMSVDRNTC